MWEASGLEKKIARYEQNINDKVRQPPNQRPKTPQIENEIVKSTSRITSALSWGKEEPSCIATREIVEIPPLIDEEGEWDYEECERTRNRNDPPSLANKNDSEEPSNDNEQKEGAQDANHIDIERLDLSTDLETLTDITEYFSASSYILDSDFGDGENEIEHENNEIDLSEMEEFLRNEALIIAMINDEGSQYTDDYSSVHTDNEFDSIIEMGNNEETIKTPRKYNYNQIGSYFETNENTNGNRSTSDNNVKSRTEMAVRITLPRTEMITHFCLEPEMCREYIQGLGYRQIIISIWKRLYVLQQSGTALEMLDLLRRCLYPRRDVIRWEQN